MIYENGTLSKILTNEGYITLSGTAPTYHYYLKDHLGNNRVVLNQNGTTVEQMNHYYPFGGLFDQISETLQAYKYNGKELDRTYWIDLYDYSARFMDGAVGRFTTMDPLAEKYYSVSLYGYVMNNPVKFVDPDGRKPRIYVETKGLFGHAFVTVGNGDKTIVYTYGRYAELGKDKSSARGSTPTGEGVLIKLTGNEAKMFIKDQITNNQASAFEITGGSDMAVANYFEGKFNRSSKIPSTGTFANSENARVIDEYNLFSNNCVTISVEGIQNGTKQDLKIDTSTNPVGLKDILDIRSNQEKYEVTKVPYESIKKELNLSDDDIKVLDNYE